MTTTMNGIKRALKGFMFKHMHRMMTCLEFENFITDYLDGSLPDQQRARFEFHTRICRECRQYLEAYQRTREITQAVLTSPEAPLPEDVPEDLIKAILDARNS